jgi:hypothetical protein
MPERRHRQRDEQEIQRPRAEVPRDELDRIGAEAIRPPQPAKLRQRHEAEREERGLEAGELGGRRLHQ